MVQGFNHNIKHKGKLFHIQTEDSGRDNPHIITHVFVGGNILATKKTSYADIVKADRLETIVRELMEEQHKSVLRNLINGVYDNADRPSTELGVPASVESTGATVAPATPATTPAAKAGAASKAAPAAGTTKAAPMVPVPKAASAGKAASAPALPSALPPPAAAAAAVVSAPTAGGEKSLDEIILSYLADRDGE